MLDNFYKVAYNYYIRSNERDIPHLAAVLLASLPQLINVISLITLIETWKDIDILDKLVTMEISIVILISHLILFHKYANRKPELFDVAEKFKTYFIVYLISSTVFIFGVMWVHPPKNGRVRHSEVLFKKEYRIHGSIMISSCESLCIKNQVDTGDV